MGRQYIFARHLGFTLLYNIHFLDWKFLPEVSSDALKTCCTAVVVILELTIISQNYFLWPEGVILRCSCYPSNSLGHHPGNQVVITEVAIHSYFVIIDKSVIVCETQVKDVFAPGCSFDMILKEVLICILK